MELEAIRSACLAFPGVTEDIKWESNLCFCIGGKIFCIANLEPPHTFSFKVREEEFEEMCQSGSFRPAPYLARAKWVLIEDMSGISSKKLNDYLSVSYNLIKAKLPLNTRKKLGLE
jgi:predicted DNA-binding protein (MmcQ/YjbR family)